MTGSHAGPWSVDWLTAQRWFRSKRRAVAAVEVIDEAPLDGAALLVLRVAYVDGGEDRYQVAAVRDRDSAREPTDGEGTWRRIATCMAARGTLHGRSGRFTFEATPALDELSPSPTASLATLDERRLRVEQTNTSVVLGERLILKLYRLLEPGVNPDLEVSAFLTDVGFAGTPAVAGWATYEPDDGAPCAAAMLQAFVPSEGDAWAAMLRDLAADPDVAIDAARRIGRLSRELHAALASRRDDPAFPTRGATVDELAAWQLAAERQLAAALEAAEGRLDHLRGPIAGQLAAIAAAEGARVSRIHGDYHLGQLLATRDGGFCVIDFEGEPARSLDERRAVASPLRDVAGMLRSLDYAARTAERGDHASGFGAEAWLARARGAFLGGYGGIGSAEAELLAAFELEKACYEVVYEANNRPDWLWLPLDALARLARGA